MKFPDIFTDLSRRVGNGRTRYWRLAEASSAEVEPRSGEKGRVCEGVHLPVKGVWVCDPQENFENLYANMCIPSTFGGNIWICNGWHSMISRTFPWLCLFSLPWLCLFPRLWKMGRVLLFTIEVYGKTLNCNWKKSISKNLSGMNRNICTNLCWSYN